MRFATIFTALTFGLGFINAAPILDLHAREELALGETSLDLDAIINTIRDIDATVNLPLNGGASVNSNALSKRETSYFVEKLLSHFAEADLKQEFVNMVARAPEFAHHLTESFKKNLQNQKIPVQIVERALNRANLLPRFFETALEDNELKHSVLSHAKRLYEEGNLELDLDLVSKRESIFEVAGISKRDSSIISSIINYLSSSNILEEVATYIFNNPQIVSAGESLISSAIANIDWSSLFSTIANSGIASNLINSLSQKRELQLQLAQVISVKARRAADFDPKVAEIVRRGLVQPVKRDAPLEISKPASRFPDGSNSVTSIDPALQGILGLLGDDAASPAPSVASSAVASSAVASPPAPVVATPVASPPSSPSPPSPPSPSTPVTPVVTPTVPIVVPPSPSSAVAVPPVVPSAVSSALLIPPVVSPVIPVVSSSKPKSPTISVPTTLSTITLFVISTTLKPTSATTSTSSSSSGSTIEDLLNALFGGSSTSTSGSNSNSTTTSTSSGSSSTDSIIGDLLGALLGNSTSSGSSASSNSTGTGSLGSIFGSLFSSILSDLFGPSNTTSTGTSSGGSGLSLSSLLGSIFSDFFGSSSSSGSGSSGSGSDFSFSSLLGSIFNSLFGSSSGSSGSGSGSGFSFSSLLGSIFDSLFGSSSSSSSSSSGSGFSFSSLLGSIFNSLFGGSSSSTGSTPSTVPPATGASATGAPATGAPASAGAPGGTPATGGTAPAGSGAAGSGATGSTGGNIWFQILSDIFSWLWNFLFGTSNGGSSLFSTLLSDLFGGNSSVFGNFSLSSLLGDILDELINSGFLETILEDGVGFFLGNSTIAGIADSIIEDVLAPNSAGAKSLGTVLTEVVDTVVSDLTAPAKGTSANVADISPVEAGSSIAKRLFVLSPERRELLREEIAESLKASLNKRAQLISLKV